MSDYHIRKATDADVATILRFIRELAIYEEAEHEVEATEASLADSLFGPDSVTHAVLCEKGGKPVGFAVYFFNYSTWKARHGLFLEDLFVTPSERGGGAGKQLLQYLASVAVERGCARFEWNVLDWNEPAIRFYESLGARPQSEWVGYRMTGKALEDLAAGGR
ncbi:L-amino acid N-acyltransferase YncA [Tamilnaduibacter salinus]|uniref:GNAT family N-acetyltransferase n=1 Tax=Tamilnaduibacter salinus TaxID=1484056 RepID=A0A2A2HYU4_9GAMM|nr:GNAT family N-acetyltransferase [Tamilnaduibacter salinus]PAV24691.1 GNAT family N-acetyltransferase [Tamilnaduibacter salinus]PVY79058.1 L-amino acid N-acyltransferase YncA [Tamilnaduibacter salinus]